MRKKTVKIEVSQELFDLISKGRGKKVFSGMNPWDLFSVARAELDKIARRG